MKDPHSRLRVLFINRMASMVRGGGETWDLEMARYLEKRGVETSFLTGLPLFSGATSPLDRPRSHTIRSPYTGWFPWDRVKQGWRLRIWDFERFERKAAAWVARHQNQFDLVQICEMPPLIDDLRRAGCTLPIVIRATAPDYHDPKGAVKRAEAMIAAGMSIAVIRAKDRPDCVDIPNGVDTDLFAPGSSDVRKRLGIPEDAFVVVFVARFQQVKNHPMLLRAFAQLKAHRPDARLLLAGSGPMEGELRELIKNLEMEKEVIFLGETPYDQIPGVYRAGDVGVISSFSESFSFATLEAMATGLPMVVTQTDWIPQLLGGDEGGMVVPNDDADAFAAGLMALANDPVLRRVQGTRNRNFVVAHYRWENSARLLHELYENLLEPAFSGA